MSSGLTPLDIIARDRIATSGPITFVELVELALYDPDHGFYTTVGEAGRRGDFLTSPEVGPLFGHVVANALDAEWTRLGRPESFTVLEYGAGPGTLARSVLAAEPGCGPALRYVAIESSAKQRAKHPDGIESFETLPNNLLDGGVVGVVLANEFLDNLAFAPFELVEGEPHELAVTLDSDGDLSPIPGTQIPAEIATRLGDAPNGVLQSKAADWLSAAVDLLARGRVIVIDYARTETVAVEIRTYADHERGGDPLVGLGTKDITVDVDLAQLQAAVRPADAVTLQADWLARNGIEELVEEGRQMWEAGAATGSLAALRGRSRVREAEALTERSGLGGFYVAEWAI